MQRSRMPATIVVDRFGRRIEPDDGVVPDGGRVVVPFRFMDARSAHVQRAFGDGLLHAPGCAAAALGDGRGDDQQSTFAERGRSGERGVCAQAFERLAGHAEDGNEATAGSCCIRAGRRGAGRRRRASGPTSG